MTPREAKIPQWIQQLQREFPDLTWQKRSWIAKVFEREVRTIDRYFDGTSKPDSDTIQEFRDQLEIYVLATQMIAEHRRKGSLAKPPETVQGKRPDVAPTAEDDMKEWLARLLKFIEGVIDSEDQALALRDHVMYEWLPEWKRQHPLAEGSQS